MNTIHIQSKEVSPKSSLRRSLLLLGLVGLTSLSGATAEQMISLGDQNSEYNREIFQLAIWAIGISVVIFVGVSGALFYTVQKFREDRNDQPAQQFHGNDKLEVWLISIPVVIVLALSVFSIRTIAKTNPVKGTEAIEAKGYQFWWQFTYPNAKAAAGGAVANGNEMIMPTKERVAVTTTSGDVIHGFWAPNIGGQRASIPSVDRTWDVNTRKEGIYQGNCSQLCGASHANMRYKVVALERDRYDTFVKAAQEYKAPTPAAGSAEERGYNLFMKGKPETGALPCSSCHRVQGTSAAGVSGPDLSFFGTRRTLGAGMWEAYTPEQWEEPKAAKVLHEWIKNTAAVKPGAIMPSYDGSEYRVNGKMMKGGVLTDDEISDIAAYLRTLKLPDEADYWKGTPIISGENGDERAKTKTASPTAQGGKP